MRITMVSGSTFLAILRTSRPPILGILRSVMTTSMDEVLRIRSAASPDSAVITSYPLGLRISSYDKRTCGSSSTMRMVSAIGGLSPPPASQGRGEAAGVALWFAHANHRVALVYLFTVIGAEELLLPKVSVATT